MPDVTPRVERVLAVFGAVAAVLVGAAYLDFGTELAGGASPLRVLLGVAVAGSLATGWWMNRRQRAAALAVTVGLLAFLFGVYGGTVGCNAAEYPQNAEYGAEYDWETNVLRFGDNVDGTDYRCRGTPNRAAVVVGYALTGVGAVELFA